MRTKNEKRVNPKEGYEHKSKRKMPRKGTEVNTETTRCHNKELRKNMERKWGAAVGRQRRIYHKRRKICKFSTNIQQVQGQLHSPTQAPECKAKATVGI